MSERTSKSVRKRKSVPEAVEGTSRTTRSSVHKRKGGTNADKDETGSDAKVAMANGKASTQDHSEITNVKDSKTRKTDLKKRKTTHVVHKTNKESGLGAVKQEETVAGKKELPVEDKVLKSQAMKEESTATNTVSVNGSVGATGKKYAGAHVSAAGGLENAITDAVNMGASSFALFLRSQRQWNSKPLEEATVDKFKAACEEHGFPPHLILPHGSYLLNLGSPNQETLQKSRDLLTDELKRCERLGLLLYNFHPGSSCGKMETSECIRLIAEGINIAHRETKYVKTVLENMSKQGFTVGGDLQEIRDIIDLVEDKSRVGVCIDTCHTFAAGYDISTKQGFQNFLDEFDKIIGLKYLVAVHVNDSKGDLGCHKDRHENIGKGKLGKVPFQFLMNSPHFNDIPLILETPWVEGVYKREIKLLNSFSEK